MYGVFRRISPGLALSYARTYSSMMGSLSDELHDCVYLLGVPKSILDVQIS